MWVSAAELLLLGSVSHSSGQFIKNFHWLFATSRNPRTQLRGNCIWAEGDGSGSFTGLVKKIKLIPREISAAHSGYCQIGNKLFDLRWQHRRRRSSGIVRPLGNKLRCRRDTLKLKPPKCSANQCWIWILHIPAASSLGYYKRSWPSPQCLPMSSPVVVIARLKG